MQFEFMSRATTASISTNCFFFSSRRRHTRCSRDWSSDVCSSDLERVPPRGLGRHVLLSTDSRALVDARAIGRLQVREDLIARRWLWAVQGLVTLAVVAFVGRSIARNWSEFRSPHVTLTVAPAWIAGSVVLVFLTYAMQIESWRRILAGWGQHLAFGPAARTWSVANLGRYVPCKLWSAAGLVVLAQRAGVEPGPAAASAFVIQAV